jgi:hypothetical protein
MAAKKAATKGSKPKKKEIAVLVGTELRNLWFGYATDTTRDTVTLRRARQVIYWSASVKGAGGLAVTGPNAECRIGPAVDEVQARRVTTVVIVSPGAVKAFEAQPWAG